MTAPNPANVIAYYKFDEGTGTTAFDSTPNEYDGTITGATWTTGKINSGLSFGTTAQHRYVEVSGIGATIGTGDYTANVWVYVTDASTRQRLVFLGDTTGYADVALDILIENDGTIRAQFRDGPDSSVGTATLVGSTLSEDNWYMVTLTRSGTTAELFLNAVSQDSGTDANVGASNTANLQFGRAYGTTNLLDGVLDEISIANTVYTQSEIDFLYASGSPTSEQQYPFSSTPPPFTITTQAATNIFSDQATLNGEVSDLE